MALITTETVTYDQVLGFTKQDLGLTGTTDHDATLELYIDEAVRSIGNLRRIELTSMVVDIIDNKIKLPRGLQDFLGLRFVEMIQDPESTNTSAEVYMFRDLWYLNFKYLNDCGLDQSSMSKYRVEEYKNTFKIVDGYIVFNFDAVVDYTKAQIAYTKLQQDDHGRMLIFPDYERAIRNYAAYQFAIRFPEQYSSLFMNDKRATWQAQKKYIRGQDQEESWTLNKPEVQKIIHTLFIDQYT